MRVCFHKVACSLLVPVSRKVNLGKEEVNFMTGVLYFLQKLPKKADMGLIFFFHIFFSLPFFFPDY